MTKHDAMKAILDLARVDCESTLTGIDTSTPEVGRIYILEETANTPARVVTFVADHLCKSTYDWIVKGLTGSIYLFKVSKVNKYNYKDWDYNVVRTHTRSIDGELRCMD